MEQRTGAAVLAVLDGYRVTGPARQLLAQAAAATPDTALITLAVFQRASDATPLVRIARRLQVPTLVVPDRFPGDPRTALALARLAAQPGIEILQTHGYKANVLAALVAPIVRRPWVAFVHGDTWENSKVRAYFALERLAIRRADRIVVVCHQMARVLAASGVPEGRIRVIHNACLIDPIHEPEAPATCADARPIIGVVGRLSPEKGVDIACRVHQTVVRHCPRARLWIVGEGPEKERLLGTTERLGIASSVDWMGFREDLGPLYRQMAVLLIPSRSEGLPNVALEAMAHGVPVVGTSVGGVPEVVTNASTGFLVSRGDVEMLAARVLELLHDAALRHRLGRQAREAAFSRFSPAVRYQKLARLYGEMTAWRG